MKTLISSPLLFGIWMFSAHAEPVPNDPIAVLDVPKTIQQLRISGTLRNRSSAGVYVLCDFWRLERKELHGWVPMRHVWPDAKEASVLLKPDETIERNYNLVGFLGHKSQDAVPGVYRIREAIIWPHLWVGEPKDFLKRAESIVSNEFVIEALK